MFTFDDWNLSYDGQVLAMQHDNKSRQILVQGTFPVGYTWAMEVQVGTAWDAIVLSPVSGGLAALLTQDNLAYAGWYEMQLRGAQGDVVRRTNIIRVHVPRSLSGTGQWPTVPSEFIQIEQRIADLNAHPSKPGVNGYWMVWDPDAQEYRESDIPLPDVSVGPAGPAATVEVAETITGAPGSDASVENLGTENAALLRFTIPSGPAGPAGTTPQISVTVTTLPAGQDVTVQVSGPAEAPTIAFGIPQGQPGERGPQGLQGIQGWGLSAAELDGDGALVLTIRNPADGQTQTLPPVPIDNSAALQAVAAAITAQGTTQAQRVEEAGDDAVGAVSTAKDAALEAVGQAQTTATGAVASAKTTAVQAVQDAQVTATTAISQAQSAAVGAVDAAKTDALDSVGALVQQAEDAAIRQPIISDHDTWMIWDAASSQYVDTGLYAGGQAPYIGADGYWYVGDVKTDTLARGPKGDPGEGVPSTEGVPTDYLLSPSGWVAPPSGGGGNDSPYELITTIEITEDGIAQIERTFDKKYTKLLISNIDIFSLGIGNASIIGMTKDNGLRVRLYGENQSSYFSETRFPLPFEQSRRHFISIDILNGLCRGIGSSQVNSGGFILGNLEGLVAGFSVMQKYKSDWFNKIVLYCDFANPVTLYIYGVPYQGGAV